MAIFALNSDEKVLLVIVFPFLVSDGKITLFNCLIFGEHYTETQKTLISRYVPIKTKKFIDQMLKPEAPQKLTKKVTDQLEKNGLYVKMGNAESIISNGIKEDFSRLDIPIFLRNEQGIFYGSIKPENLIAKRR